MCGLSVILDVSGSPRLSRVLEAMHARIPHRGPDGQGFLLCGPDGRVARGDTMPDVLDPLFGMAFRRLKICDLSDAAAQPMVSADGRTAIVFNGEIYNFVALRAELLAKGHAFRSQGDTEVVLAAYREWGTECFRRFEGMWAIVLLDLSQRRLVVSRDRFGIKPLLWARAPGGALLIASEIKQILAALDGPPAANRPLVEMYLRGQRYPVLEETFFEGIRMAPPATWAAVALDAPEDPCFRPYWSLRDFTANGNLLCYGEAVDRVEEVLGRAVNSHRRADVKVGALLSGGLDSSTLVGLSLRSNGPKLQTYSLGYRAAAPALCELPFVDAMVQQCGLENYETSIDAAWIERSIDRVLGALEEPPLAMPAFAQYRVFELCAAQGVTVILDGQGADEIAAGYAYHQRAFLKDRITSGRLFAMVRELLAMARRQKRSGLGLFADQFIFERFAKRPAYDFIVPVGHRPNADEMSDARMDRGDDLSAVNRQLYFDVRWGNVKIILGYGDRSAMANAIEARVPYFDRAFVELLFSLPDTFKVGLGERKRVLRDVARRHVPPEITERSDRLGFGTPDEAMIRGPLAAAARAAIADAIDTLSVTSVTMTPR